MHPSAIAYADLGPDATPWSAIERIATAKWGKDDLRVARDVARVIGPKLPQPLFGRAVRARG